MWPPVKCVQQFLQGQKVIWEKMHCFTVMRQTPLGCLMLQKPIRSSVFLYLSCCMIFFFLDKLKDSSFENLKPMPSKANSKTIYKIRINNLQESAYSLLTGPIIQSLIYILSSTSWSRTACTFAYRPAAFQWVHSWTGAMSLLIRDSLTCGRSHERIPRLKGFQVKPPQQLTFSWTGRSQFVLKSQFNMRK